MTKVRKRDISLDHSLKILMKTAGINMTFIMSRYRSPHLLQYLRGNRKEAARISAEFYDFGQGHRSWADRSPLHDAACQGRLFALRNLILQVSQRATNVNVITIDNVSPLHEACFGDHVACARALIAAGANVNVTTIDGVTPLFNACSVGSVSCAEVLLENGAKPEALVFQPLAHSRSQQ
ncbi:hypothetical protein J4Q44_G00316160 [Coregonus suidteri]|uniref:Uncharacterized protein n=1 Tax=Coregonus suidteri TaxID=861788 RepID=A0AAN8L1H6_9TELE